MSCGVFFMIPATIWSQQSRGIAGVWSPPPKPVCAPREEGWHPFQTKVLAGPDILGFDLQTHALWFHSISERLFIYLFVATGATLLSQPLLLTQNLAMPPRTQRAQEGR